MLSFSLTVPFKGKMHNRTRLGDLVQRSQCCPQNGELTYSVSRRAQRQSEGVLDSGYARGTDSGIMESEMGLHPAASISERRCNLMSSCMVVPELNFSVHSAKPNSHWSYQW
jgi:hypothetical protein